MIQTMNLIAGLRFRLQWRIVLPALAACVLLLAGWVLATPTPGYIEDWSTVGQLEGWTNSPGVGSSLQNTSGWLIVHFNAQAGPEPEFVDNTAYAVGGAYTGSYLATGMAVRFSFKAEDFLPTYSLLYFRSGGGNEWTYEFSNTQVNQWQTQAIFFNYDYGTGWSGPGGSAQFWSDLQDVTAVGFRIRSAWELDAQDYEFDDWEYFVPEPGSVCLLAATFLSFGVTFRRRLRSSVGTLLAGASRGTMKDAS